MARRGFLSQLGGLFAAGSTAQPAVSSVKKKVLIKSAWGSDDPTKASFAFFHAAAFVKAGHEVQVFLLGEAVSVMRQSVAEAIFPVGWPPLTEALSEVLKHGVPVHV